MQFHKPLLMILLVCASASAAFAEVPPKHSANFKGNYAEMMKRTTSPQLAECVATGHDLVARSKLFDRLGMTDVEIGEATISPTRIDVPASVRRQKSGDWRDIVLSCNFRGGKLVNIDIMNP
ncbi:hypothetical protein [Chelativorans sp. J32]|uniref:hypothetical protein n=1 Tax=Chelativorans sp. J32 TaxID=935840 RepID=UPI0004B79FEC|nr:hypothetical protein [Chelativorans sp. J32]